MVDVGVVLSLHGVICAGTGYGCLALKLNPPVETDI